MRQLLHTKTHESDLADCAKVRATRTECQGVTYCGECAAVALQELRLRIEAVERSASVSLTMWLVSKVRKIEKDARFQATPAHVQVNAPLAMTQVELKAQHRVYTDVLTQLERKS